MKHMEPSASEFTVSSDRDAMNMRRVQRLALATTSVSYVMIILDTSVVNVALGDIAESLALSRCRLANVFLVGAKPVPQTGRICPAKA